MAQNKKFLEDNKKAEGVVTLPSGLQYKVLKAGDGATPGARTWFARITRANLIDGTVFDSSYDRGEPAEFPVGGVIKGWTEALQKMKVGDKWQLVIPSELAYGEAGAGGVIPPTRDADLRDRTAGREEAVGRAGGVSLASKHLLRAHPRRGLTCPARPCV